MSIPFFIMLKLDRTYKNIKSTEGYVAYCIVYIPTYIVLHIFVYIPIPFREGSGNSRMDSSKSACS